MPELNPIDAPGPDAGRPASGGVLTIRQVNIGQGNLTYIICPNGKRVLIDAGTDDLGNTTLANVAANLDYMNDFNPVPAWDAQANLNFLYVDVIILTHGDKDHYNKIPNLLGWQTVVQWIYTGGPRGDYTESLAFREWVFNGNVATHYDPVTRRQEPNLAQIIINGTDGHNEPLLLCDGSLPGQTACQIWALAGSVGNAGAGGNKNTKSIVVKIVFGNTSAMITGDATVATETFMLDTLNTDILDSPTPFRSNILLVPHHGSETSSSELFIQAVLPKTALISAKNRNDHGLPRQEIVQRYTDPAGMLNQLAADQTHQITTYIDQYTLSNPPMSTAKDIWQTGVSGTRSYRLDGVNVTLI